jgi:hypothetical protein
VFFSGEKPIASIPRTTGNCTILKREAYEVETIPCMDKGFLNIYVLKGGWNEWIKAKYPTEAK